MGTISYKCHSLIYLHQKSECRCVMSTCVRWFHYVPIMLVSSWFSVGAAGGYCSIAQFWNCLFLFIFQDILIKSMFFNNALVFPYNFFSDKIYCYFLIRLLWKHPLPSSILSLCPLVYVCVLGGYVIIIKVVPQHFMGIFFWHCTRDAFWIFCSLDSHLIWW